MGEITVKRRASDEDINPWDGGAGARAVSSPTSRQEGARWRSLIREAHAVVGRPLTPVSAAGVARRTTRRMIVATSRLRGRAPAGLHGRRRSRAPRCISAVPPTTRRRAPSTWSSTFSEPLAGKAACRARSTLSRSPSESDWPQVRGRGLDGVRRHRANPRRRRTPLAARPRGGRSRRRATSARRRAERTPPPAPEPSGDGRARRRHAGASSIDRADLHIAVRGTGTGHPLGALHWCWSSGAEAEGSVGTTPPIVAHHLTPGSGQRLGPPNRFGFPSATQCREKTRSISPRVSC